MKSKTIVFLSIMLIGIGLSASAEPYILRDDNAAIRYLLAMGHMPQMTREEHKQLRDVNCLESFSNIPDEIVNKLERATSQPILSLLEFAAKAKDCNFMPDQSFNPTDYVAPYRLIRNFAVYLNAAGWKAAADGNYKRAAGLFVSVFRFGDDASKYGPLLGHMIGVSNRTTALKSMINFMSGPFSIGAKSIITDFLSSLPDPAFDAKKAFEWEKFFLEQILQSIDSHEAAYEMFQGIYGESFNNDEESVKDVNKELKDRAKEYYKSGKFAADRQEMLQYYEKMLSLDLSKDNALEKIAKIQSDYESGENKLIREIAIDFNRFYSYQFALQEKIAKLLK